MKTIYIILIIVFLYLSICNNCSNIKTNLVKEEFKSSKLKKYKLCIVAIFKNEQDYMEEWIDYHIAQGFDQIFLYCNDPNLNKYPYLLNDKYKKFVTLIDWTNKENNGSNTVQRQAYKDCIKNYGNLCQFLLILDLDEFVHPYKQFNTVSDYIDSLIHDWSNIQSFKIQRYDFGSNGHKKKPNIPVTNAYTKHEKICSTYKAMANMDYVDTNDSFFGVHDFPYSNLDGKIYNDYLNYRETGYPSGCKQNSINEIPLVINHYYTKSYDEYIKRCDLWKNGGINPIGYRKNCEEEFKNRDVNDSEDFKLI